MIVTTSWDDGSVHDRRLADLLAKYGVAGTFYVPTRNVEGRDVLSPQDLRAVALNFEIGGHTRDHVVLPGMPREAAARQIGENKAYLEDVTGRVVDGFCYPRGKFDAAVKLAVKEAGFRFARTVVNLRNQTGSDLFEIPTTIQLFPHPRSVYLRNALRNGLGPGSFALLTGALSESDLFRRVVRLAEICSRSGAFFHIWGHSWEIEEFGLWDVLERVLQHVSGEYRAAEFSPNARVAAQ